MSSTTRDSSGVLDTCAYLDLADVDPDALPAVPELTAITLAELSQGVAMAKDPATRTIRSEQLGAAILDFEPLPFDEQAAVRYGTLVALVLVAKRNPRPRRMDLQIAAIASARGLPLYTRSIDDFKGLDSMVEVIEI